MLCAQCVHYKFNIKMKPADPLTQTFYSSAQTLQKKLGYMEIVTSGVLQQHCFNV